jgi:hypothetical protein
MDSERMVFSGQKANLKVAAKPSAARPVNNKKETAVLYVAAARLNKKGTKMILPTALFARRPFGGRLKIGKIFSASDYLN